MSKCFIYGLIDPETRLIRYIGKTTVGIARIYEHQKRRPEKTGPYCRNWLNRLHRKGLNCEWVILEDHQSGESLAEAEIWWISYARISDWPLTNLTDGGDGSPGRKFSDETIARMSRTRKGRKLTAEHRKKLSDAGRGRKHTAQSKLKMSASKKGRPVSQEHRDKIAQSLKGRPLSEGTKNKLSLANKGKQLSTETKKKLSDHGKHRMSDPDKRNEVRQQITKIWATRSDEDRSRIVAKNKEHSDRKWAERWSPELISRLGRELDHIIAADVGVPRHVIVDLRRSLGIPGMVKGPGNVWVSRRIG